MAKKVSIMIFHDELCQVFNGLMTALSLLRAGSDVTVFFGSRGINTVHKEKVKKLRCMPDEPKEVGDKVMKKMEEMNLPTALDMLTMLDLEGALLLACPLNKDIFDITEKDLVDGVSFADPETYYTDIVMEADMNLAF